jgi:Fe2+ transport system protein FeoA
MKRRSIHDLSIGEINRIAEFEDPKIASLLLGMGLDIGKSVQCVHKSGGSVIIANGRTIAMGSEVAKRVYVV